MNAKILIAEDTPDLLELMKDRLTHEGFAVVPCRDGTEAWDKIRQENPDVILLDIMMPGMDGFQVLEKLRNEPPCGDKYQPVIIISAKGELEDLKRGYALEADHYITKPWEMKDVLKGIHLVLKLAGQKNPGPPAPQP